MSGTDPVRWWVFDHFIHPPSELPPPPDWGGWECHYNNDLEHGKRTSRRFEGAYPFSRPWVELLTAGCAGEWSERLGYPVEQDPTLHGGGLHVMRPGGWLQVHLDYSRHPKLPTKRRALNLILFLHDRWDDEWGGYLLLCRPNGERVARIRPTPGRLVVFETTELAYHGVEQTSPDADERVSFACYLLADANGSDVRTCALFKPNRRAGECPAEVALV